MDSFFGIGFPELILILIVAGIVMGPERIGQAARWIGRTSGQLQRISRGFVRQLNQELDSSGDGQALKETMQELQQLRKELTDLRGEVNQSTNEAAQAGRQAYDEIQNSMAPPNLKPPTLPTVQEDEAVSNGSSTPADGPEKRQDTGNTAVPRLPSLLDIPDDPE